MKGSEFVRVRSSSPFVFPQKYRNLYANTVFLILLSSDLLHFRHSGTFFPLSTFFSPCSSCGFSAYATLCTSITGRSISILVVQSFINGDISIVLMSMPSPNYICACSTVSGSSDMLRVLGALAVGFGSGDFVLFFIVALFYGVFTTFRGSLIEFSSDWRVTYRVGQFYDSVLVASYCRLFYRASIN